MTDTAEVDLEKLRARIERALERSDAASTALATNLLERLLSLVTEGSDDATFAHRQLAEILLEREPWRAALHIRKALAHGESDDALHAMMGLCQALLGNYRAAIAAYGRASRLAPSIGWYHHNLGHLLDVALDDPAAAEPHLRTAYRIASHHDEVVASLAHCLARLERKDEALELAQKARSLKPNKPAHRELVEWIVGESELSPPQRGTRGAQSSRAAQGGRGADDDRRRDVADAFDQQMKLVGYSEPMVRGAHRMWNDFSRGRTLRVVKTAVYAAAVEYAIASLSAWPGVTQASVARRYGVAPASVGTRFGELREALGLRRFDARYMSKT